MTKKSSYVALARGGVNSQHVLILPIQHHQSSLTIPDDVAAEVEEYKKALRWKLLISK